MEEFQGPSFDGIANAVRRKRTQTSRRPRPDSQPVSENHDISPLSSTPSDEVSKSDEDDGGVNNSRRKEFNLNQNASRPASRADVEKSYRNINEDGGYNAVYGCGNLKDGSDLGRSGLINKRSSESILAPANWKGTSMMKSASEAQSQLADIHGGHSGMPLDGNENKVKKVKLKVGGVTRTIDAKTATSGALFGTSSGKSSRDNPKPRKLILQENLEDSHSPPPRDKRSGLQGIPWKDFSKGGFTLGKEDSLMGRTSAKNTSGKDGDKQGDKLEPLRKSKRIPKKRVLDRAFEDDDDDDEIRYLEKLKTSKISSGYVDDDEESGRIQRKFSRVSKIGAIDTKYDGSSEDIRSSWSGKDGKRKPRSDKVYEDADYEEEDGTLSDGEADGKKKKKQKKESLDTLMESKREMTLTTRQRALQSGKDTGLIEFPNGLPPAPPRKQKEKLSEVEQQLKKAEAAQRRRMQVEKQNRENEAEAIRKILGQDSNKKRRDEKLKKRQEELAQEKAALAEKLASTTIRTVMGPTGTTVTFPKEMGLPSIFDSKPISYPPPREKCAGPSCTNPFRYRDSKTKVPLCSLECYKAVHEKMKAESSG
ncbi:INO80 complex subunit B-like conserved region [Dillenia turbinata]|uniref:INO80 complex subunit B-like conserved region n=1 Tax=Dillenia turbinata TaxID=194707 RepID=A0AAN8VVR6_9MAGN